MGFENGVWVEWAIIDQNATNVTHLGEAMTYINSVTGNLFGYLILLAIFVIIFIAGINRENDSLASLSTALFITTIIGYLFTGIGLVGAEAIIPLTITLVIAVVLMYRGGSSGV